MEFASGVLGSEPPVNGSSYRVPLRHAGADGSFQAVFNSVASAQAGPGQHAELDLRHIQPASVLGRCGGYSGRLAMRQSSAAGRSRIA